MKDGDPSKPNLLAGDFSKVASEEKGDQKKIASPRNLPSVIGVAENTNPNLGCFKDLPVSLKEATQNTSRWR